MLSQNLYKPVVTFFETKEMMYNHAQDLIADTYFDTVQKVPYIRLAFSGGITPIPLYKKLANNPLIDWKEVELYQTDERYISTNSQESNQKNIVDALGKHVISEVKEKYFFDTTMSIEKSLEHYRSIIDSFDDEGFDITILGIGKDGHFASLFPGINHYQENSGVIATTAPIEYTTNLRLTLSLKTILNSKMIIVLLSGESKKDVVSRLIEGKESVLQFPAKFLLLHPSLQIFQSPEE